MEKAIPTPPKATSVSRAQSKPSKLPFKPFILSLLKNKTLKNFKKNMSSSSASATNSTQPQDRAYNRVDVGFAIHGLCWHETIRQVTTDTKVATLNDGFEKFTGALHAQFYFDAGKGKTRHLYYTVSKSTDGLLLSNFSRQDKRRSPSISSGKTRKS